MPVNFRIKDFFYPFSILKMNRFLSKSQWFSASELKDYQFNRLKILLHHAYTYVPYYNAVFKSLKFHPSDIKSLNDLSKLPLLNKTIIKEQQSNLLAKNAKKFHPIAHRTSGSTGEPVGFYLDKPSNVLEFCYYWRQWKWAGYTLGNRFVELANDFFLLNKGKAREVYHLNPITQSLKLNPLLLSNDHIHEFAVCIRKYKPKFLIGLASGIYYFALFLENNDITDITFNAIFSHGEMLLTHHRALIEDIFSCKVLDSYGHMERTIGICECPAGGYHVNPEYGILEIIDRQSADSQNTIIGKAVGTSLHNFAMPFIRYELNDYIEIPTTVHNCSCGRGLPLITKIHGRLEDIIITPDDRIITDLFTLFDDIEGISLGQVVQLDRRKLLLRIASNESYTYASEEQTLMLLRGFVGNMDISIEYVTLEQLREEYPRKFKVIVSHLSPNRFII